MRWKKEQREGKWREEDKFNDFYSIYSICAQRQKQIHFLEVCVTWSGLWDFLTGFREKSILNTGI